MSSNVRVEVLFALRDNGPRLDLSTAEVLFLFVVESHGTCFASAATLAEEMRISLPTFYRLRKGLVGRGLLTAERRTGSTTVYRVNSDALGSTTGDKTPTPQGVSQVVGGSTSGDKTPLSSVVDPSTTGDKTKETLKETKKETKEGEGADAPLAPVSFFESSTGAGDPGGGISKAASAASAPFGDASKSLDDVVRESNERQREVRRKEEERDRRISERDRFRARLRAEEQDRKERFARGDIAPHEMKRLVEGLGL